MIPVHIGEQLMRQLDVSCLLCSCLLCSCLLSIACVLCSYERLVVAFQLCLCIAVAFNELRHDCPFFRGQTFAGMSAKVGANHVDRGGTFVPKSRICHPIVGVVQMDSTTRHFDEFFDHTWVARRRDIVRMKTICLCFRETG